MVLAPSNRERVRATTIDYSSKRCPCSSEADGDDDDCYRIDGNSENGICSVVF